MYLLFLWLPQFLGLSDPLQKYRHNLALFVCWILRPTSHTTSFPFFTTQFHSFTTRLSHFTRGFHRIVHFTTRIDDFTTRFSLYTTRFSHFTTRFPILLHGLDTVFFVGTLKCNVSRMKFLMENPGIFS